MSPTAMLIVVDAAGDVEWYHDHRGFKVVHVDFQTFIPEQMVPVEVEALVRRVANLPVGFPGRANTIKQLVNVRDAVRHDLYTGDPYHIRTRR